MHYWDPSIAPSGMAFYAGDLFPAWRGHMFVGALAGQMLVRLEIAGEQGRAARNACWATCANAFAMCAPDPTARSGCSPTRGAARSCASCRRSNGELAQTFTCRSAPPLPKGEVGSRSDPGEGLRRLRRCTIERQHPSPAALCASTSPHGRGDPLDAASPKPSRSHYAGSFHPTSTSRGLGVSTSVKCPSMSAPVMKWKRAKVAISSFS